MACFDPMSKLTPCIGNALSVVSSSAASKLPLRARLTNATSAVMLLIVPVMTISPFTPLMREGNGSSLPQQTRLGA